MKRILTLLVCATALSAGAQIPYEFPYNPDADNDAFISTTDLVEFLALFGQDFTSEELYLSDDSTNAIVLVGQSLSKTECLSACNSLEGRWRLAHQRDAVTFFDLLTEGLDDLAGPLENFELEFMWLDRREVASDMVRTEDLFPTLKNAQFNDWQQGVWELSYDHFEQTVSSTYASLPERGKAECWCATQQRPRVEWQRIMETEWEASIEQLSDEGWRMHSAEGNKVFFWRWAD